MAARRATGVGFAAGKICAVVILRACHRIPVTSEILSGISLMAGIGLLTVALKIVKMDRQASNHRLEVTA